MIRKLAQVMVAFVLLFSFVHPTDAGEDTNIRALAIQAAKSGRIDFAYMYYRAILNDYPNSPFAEEASFAHGEYFLMTSNDREAAATFNSFIQRYPQSKSKLFALAHLFQIAAREKNEELKKDLEKKIVNFKQLSLVFRDFKEYEFQSPFLRNYKAIFYIDKIEFYARGELFAKILY